MVVPVQVTMIFHSILTFHRLCKPQVTTLAYRVRHKDLPIENVTLLKNDLVFADAFNI